MRSNSKTCDRAFVYRPEKPYDLHGALLSAAVSKEDRGRLEKEKINQPSWATYPASVLEMLQEVWAVEELITFDWDNPISGGWPLRLTKLDVKSQRDYILFFIHPCRLLAFAALEPKGSPHVYSTFFKKLIEDNGKAFHIELFGSLPVKTTNYRPNLISDGVVYQSYFDWIERFQSWLGLQEEMQYRNRDPLGLSTFADLASKFADAEELLSEQDQLREESKTLLEAAKHEILRSYFEDFYEIR